MPTSLIHSVGFRGTLFAPSAVRDGNYGASFVKRK